MDKKILNNTSTILFYLSILIFIIAFNFAHNLPSGWYQQFLPNLGTQSISDIFFIDSLKGFITTESMPINDTAYILKTTNGGDNWSIIFNAADDLSRTIFINENIGLACGGDLYKSTNSGNNWFTINRPNQTRIEDMSVLNEDTIWLVDSDGLTGGVFRTTNGGASWQQQLALGSQNPDKIYMFNSRIGFISENGGTRYIRKTTNSGSNWTLVVSNDYFNDIYFADSLTGWKCSVFGMKKTIDGGLSWITQTLPSGGIIQTSGISNFSNINRDLYGELVHMCYILIVKLEVLFIEQPMEAITGYIKSQILPFILVHILIVIL